MQLITGGMGFIGLHTARAFLDAGEDVVLTRFRTTREPGFIAGEIGKRVFVEPLDLTSAHDVIEIARKYQVSGIVHLAVPALKDLTAAEEFRVNMSGLINILEAARLAEAKRVILASSLAVYAAQPAGPFSEELPLPLAPTNPTDAYKKSFETLGQHYADRCALDVIIARIGGIYGPLYHSMASLASRLAHAAVRGVPGPLPNDLRPTPFAGDSVDACYVKDCGRALQLLQMAPEPAHRVYNVSSGQSAHAGDFAEAVRAAMPGAEIKMEPGRSPRYRADVTLDIARLTADTGFAPEFDIASGMADYIDWLAADNEY